MSSQIHTSLKINPTVRQSDLFNTYTFDIELVSHSVTNDSVGHFMKVEFKQRQVSAKCFFVTAYFKLYRTQFNFKYYIKYWEIRFVIPSNEQQRVEDLLKQYVECAILRESILNQIGVLELCKFQNRIDDDWESIMQEEQEKVSNFKKLLDEKCISLFGINMFILFNYIIIYVLIIFKFIQ